MNHAHTEPDSMKLSTFAPQADTAPPAWYQPLFAILRQQLGYDRGRTLAVVNYCWLWGTAEDCPEVKTEFDRREIEACLPDAEEARWLDYEGYVWTTTGDAA